MGGGYGSGTRCRSKNRGSGEPSCARRLLRRLRGMAPFGLGHGVVPCAGSFSGSGDPNGPQAPAARVPGTGENFQESCRSGRGGGVRSPCRPRNRAVGSGMRRAVSTGCYRDASSRPEIGEAAFPTDRRLVASRSRTAGSGRRRRRDTDRGRLRSRAGFHRKREMELFPTRSRAGPGSRPRRTTHSCRRVEGRSRRPSRDFGGDGLRQVHEVEGLGDRRRPTGPRLAHALEPEFAPRDGPGDETPRARAARSGRRGATRRRSRTPRRRTRGPPLRRRARSGRARDGTAGRFTANGAGFSRGGQERRILPFGGSRRERPDRGPAAGESGVESPSCAPRMPRPVVHACPLGGVRVARPRRRGGGDAAVAMVRGRNGGAPIEAVRAGRRLAPAAWPGGRAGGGGAVFDFDNETVSLRDNILTASNLSRGSTGRGRACRASSTCWIGAGSAPPSSFRR